jgi:hypothetical protein
MAATLLGVAVVAAAGMYWRARARPPVASAPAAATGPRSTGSREPRPAQKAAVMARVELTFVSDPRGAEVRDLATGELLGTTPLQRAEPALGQIVEYHLTLPGYAPRRERVLLTANPPVRTVGGPLQRRQITPPAAPARRRKTRLVGRRETRPLKETTLNPFSR